MARFSTTLVLVLVVSAQLGCGGKGSGKKAIGLDAVIADYDGDAAGADEKYKGKAWTFQGRVLRPVKGGFELEAHPPGSAMAVRCFYGEGQQPAERARGDLTIEGTCRGFKDGMVEFENCQIVLPEGT